MSATASEVRTVRGSLQTPVGVLTVLADDAGIRSVGWRYRPADREPGGSPAADHLAASLVQLEEYFAGTRTTFALPIRLAGLGDAARAVLTALRDTVGYGETVTYGELAARSGTTVPARAIGSIMGSNPVPVVIPCHRVVASDGLGGYSGGEPGRGRETKLWLLEHEGALPPTLL
ncbi:methylated-DNA--[protein]-cysteine S-methyltransferase [Microlunatus sp. Gsoil 973]|jgi:methylated-DNA-[protein]-cysteine S-methyltransferase|uniref:methylated-DNA--[protein]-cysteine S-methyltransferase n=1 Tax=Microlunatus sp. Gsoil 973 TaxID=2672569 RepID=UPI0012B4B89C|nr:methylated-DNA--[protein]-cysteine S-methyltransferase [Microlunatus sp. Gsoil 973]QGN31688.1 methylated-DNA--[protein]-cysteine S-methyltransferase [Microlunatus sp. Gsoil 973]